MFVLLIIIVLIAALGAYVTEEFGVFLFGLFMAFVVLVFSSAPSQPPSPPALPTSGTVTIGSGVTIETFTYDGHLFVKATRDKSVAIIHSPSCRCTRVVMPPPATPPLETPQ